MVTSTETEPVQRSYWAFVDCMANVMCSRHAQRTPTKDCLWVQEAAKRLKKCPVILWREDDAENCIAREGCRKLHKRHNELLKIWLQPEEASCNATPPTEPELDGVNYHLVEALREFGDETLIPISQKGGQSVLELCLTKGFLPVVDLACFIMEFYGFDDAAEYWREDMCEQPYMLDVQHKAQQPVSFERNVKRIWNELRARYPDANFPKELCALKPTEWREADVVPRMSTPPRMSATPPQSPPSSSSSSSSHSGWASTSSSQTSTVATSIMDEAMDDGNTSERFRSLSPDLDDEDAEHESDYDQDAEYEMEEYEVEEHEMEEHKLEEHELDDDQDAEHEADDVDYQMVAIPDAEPMCVPGPVSMPPPQELTAVAPAPYYLEYLCPVQAYPAYTCSYPVWSEIESACLPYTNSHLVGTPVSMSLPEPVTESQLGSHHNRYHAMLDSEERMRFAAANFQYAAAYPGQL